jgi:hypothetical protein
MTLFWRPEPKVPVFEKGVRSFFRGSEGSRRGPKTIKIIGSHFLQVRRGVPGPGRSLFFWDVFLCFLKLWQHPKFESIKLSKVRKSGSGFFNSMSYRFGCNTFNFVHVFLDDFWSKKSHQKIIKNFQIKSDQNNDSYFLFKLKNRFKYLKLLIQFSKKVEFFC